MTCGLPATAEVSIHCSCYYCYDCFNRCNICPPYLATSHPLTTATWSLVTADPGWEAREVFGLSFLPRSKSVVLVGSDWTGQNDVWSSSLADLDE